MFFYKAFGLHIASEIKIDDFEEIDESIGSDVFINEGLIDLPLEINKDCIRTILPISNGMLLYWREIGSFLVEHGSRVIFQATTTPPRIGLIKSVIMGAVLGILMYQRNSHLVFHSSVVGRRDDLGAIAFMARKGGGKSTMATAMINHSYSLVSDDLLALYSENGQLVVEPGFPGMKLWADSAERLVENGAELPMLGVNVKFEKRVLQLKENFIGHWLSLNSVFVLEYGELNQPQIQQMDKKEALLYLLPHWYGAMFNGQMLPILGKKRLLDECASLAATGRVYRLIRPKSMDKIPLSVELVDNFRRSQMIGNGSLK